MKRENIFWFTIKTLLTLMFCFPLLVFVINGLLGLTDNWYSLIFIYFIAYETLNALLFIYKNIRIIFFIVGLIDCIFTILSLILFVYFLIGLFSNPEGAWAWMYFPTIIAIFYYGFFGIVVDILYWKQTYS
jgi:hypothetical protein